MYISLKLNVKYDVLVLEKSFAIYLSLSISIHFYHFTLLLSINQIIAYQINYSVLYERFYFLKFEPTELKPNRSTECHIVCLEYMNTVFTLVVAS